MSNDAFKPTKSEPDPDLQSGQFRITTLLIWIIIVCVYLVNFGASEWMDDGREVDSDFIYEFLFGLLIFCPAATCIPYLFDRASIREDGHRFSPFWAFWLSTCLGIYSGLMIMLATIGFAPDWKGSKGMHWSFYLLDEYAGMTLWPIYFVAICFFIGGVCRSRLAESYPSYFVATVLLAGISIWYTLACFFLGFTGNEAMVFWIVPGSVGIAYSLVAYVFYRNRSWSISDIAKAPKGVVAWIIALLASIAVKIPLAIRFYNQLPDEPPDTCFIVTAAAKGHPSIVKSWLDPSRRHPVNQQLMNYYRLEEHLKRHWPKFHGMLRRVYNVVGPIVARRIKYQWQADIVYWLLKPVEWLTFRLR